MKNDYIIVPFKKEYEKHVIDLICSIQQAEFNIQITAQEQSDLNDIPHFYQRNKGNFWVVLDGDKVIGTVALLDIGDNNVALRKMFVDKNYRGKERGVAKGLFDTLLAWAREQHLERIYLGTAAAFLAAHRFYEKNGFIEINKQELPPHFPIIPVDTKFYKYAVI